MNTTDYEAYKAHHKARYHAIIIDVCDRILAPGRMAVILREQQSKRRLEILAHRDKLKPERSGLPLPKFLERWV